MTEIGKIVKHCEQVLDIKNAKLGKEYFYQSLPLCVIDAVYSVGVRYESTQNVVKRYCDVFKFQKIRADKESVPSKEVQQPIDDLLKKMTSLGIDNFATDIFKNKQRTSPKNGILKSDAVFRFATVLKKYGVNYFQDIPKIIENIGFEKEIGCIPGQNIDVSIKYFFMLSGSNEYIKADRMILRFLENILNKPVTPQEAQFLLSEVSYVLDLKYEGTTPRLLDHAIWAYQRN